MTETRQVVDAETSTRQRVQLVGGITPVLDNEGDTVALTNNLTIFGWFDKESDSLFVARLMGMLHEEALKEIEGCESFETLRGSTLEWCVNYRQVAMSLPETVRPMLLHVRQQCGMAGPIHTGMEGLSVEITDIKAGETHAVRINEKICFALMRNKRIGDEEIQFVNAFCGGTLFRLIDTPKHIREYRRNLSVQNHAQAASKQPAADAKYSAADIAASMTRLAEPQHEYFKRRKEQEQKRKQTQDRKPDQERKQEPKQLAPTFKAKKDKLPEVPDSVRLSGPQKELILMRLADIGVKIPQAVAELPLRRGRHTRQETAGIVEFTMGQLSAVNAALKCINHELVYVEEHNVYALRHTVTNLQYVFTQRDWEFVKRGKLDRRYSGR